ncbi:MAG: hypothetical protein QOG91_73 [Candidatus Parcubacteria bacterium]|jgi:hypothetical protein|nr:hypothetical protein [Candidatus Parcubacteria bacterium]
MKYVHKVGTREDNSQMVWRSGRERLEKHFDREIVIFF